MDISNSSKGGPFGLAGGRVPKKERRPPAPLKSATVSQYEL